MRLAGADRFETAGLIAGEVVELGGPVDAAIVARADSFADALAAGNLASAARAPILLTATDALPRVTVEALADTVGGDSVTIAGGDLAVSPVVERSLAGEGYATTRLFGAERYSTAARFVEAALTAGASPSTAILASGTTFPDALAAVPVSHALGGITVLVDPSDLEGSGASADLIAANAAAIRTLYVAGGVQAISDGVLGQARALLE